MTLVQSTLATASTQWMERYRIYFFIKQPLIFQSINQTSLKTKSERSKCDDMQIGIFALCLHSSMQEVEVSDITTYFLTSTEI
jgi:hypothetical protein